MMFLQAITKIHTENNESCISLISLKRCRIPSYFLKYRIESQLYFVEKMQFQKKEGKLMVPFHCNKCQNIDLR